MQTDEVTIVGSRETFCALARRMWSEGQKSLFGKILPNSKNELIVHSSQTSASWGPLAELELAPSEDPGVFWDRLWSDQRELLLVCPGDGVPVVCMTTSAAWRSLPGAALVYSKSLFEERTDQEVIALIGEDEFNTMCHESFLMSISIRTCTPDRYAKRSVGKKPRGKIVTRKTTKW